MAQRAQYICVLGAGSLLRARLKGREHSAQQGCPLSLRFGQVAVGQQAISSLAL
eukprot:CAMPEP_0194752396 /NCGR_PEP_ID=MMETSP0323_2-20130528/6156_1 /TAXON_ID=2866 ORGANISM="Crypthecodinium cohnii, Strain Seligo" /NCGR_SAMPLE_ID=MMETSP0323_2 /ASSEMBLY_ACC=CAM_ASM_000346 /LENGTH=53 /DNA_ID=CAMNT_0039669253 /DNA_START=235 /DNA_END=396 /DNA_ORIENTATION=-